MCKSKMKTFSGCDSTQHILSHPNKPLRDHLVEVAGLMQESCERYDSDDESLGKLAYMIGLSHDIGKGTKYFQQYLSGEQGDNRLKSHADISAVFAFFVVNKNHDDQTALIAYELVKRHHGHLMDLPDDIEYIHRNIALSKRLKDKIMNVEEKFPELIADLFEGVTWSEFTTSFESIVKKIAAAKREMWKDQDQLNQKLSFTAFHLLFSSLVDADKLSASGITPSSLPSLPSAGIVEQYRNTLRQKADRTKPINQLRDAIADETREYICQGIKEGKHLFKLTVPTGMGKTITAVDAALTIIEETQDTNQKIVYAVPFLSIIDQNQRVTENILQNDFDIISTDVLLAHHHLSKNEYRKQNENSKLPDDMASMYIDRWDSRIIFTSFVQLFDSLLTARNRLSKKLVSLKDAIFIIDEIQAVPLKCLTPVEEMIRLLAEHGCYVIIATATPPAILPEAVDLFPQQDRFDRLNRLTLTNEMESKTVEEFADQVKEYARIHPQKTVFAVMNTIRSAKKLYHLLSEQVENIDFLSTGVIPKERMERIKMLGESKESKVLVTTQLIEAGVDCSADKIYRDFAPFDSILQTCGRCNRHDEPGKKGEVTLIRLVEPGDSPENDSFFSNFVYDSVLLSATDQLFADQDKQVFLEQDLYSMASEYAINAGVENIQVREFGMISFI